MSQLNYLEKLLDGVDVEWKPLDDISVKISSGLSESFILVSLFFFMGQNCFLFKLSIS